MPEREPGIPQLEADQEKAPQEPIFDMEAETAELEKFDLEKEGGIRAEQVESREAQEVVEPRITDAEFRETGPEDRLNKKLESFGLTLEAITETVPKFNELSPGKKLLVLENLQQLTLGRIQEEAQDKYRTGVQESKWRGRLWKGITKHFQVRKLEEATAQELQTGGIEAHKTMLRELTELTESMPEVEVQNDGTLAIGYAREFENATREQKWAVVNFNRKANAFARMPEEWSFSTANKKEQQQYRAAKQVYDEARDHLLTANKEALGESQNAEARAMAYVNEAEFAVRMNQFLNTNPDVEKQLQSIKNEKALTKAIKDIFVERTGLLVGGAIVRSFTVSTLGWVAAPIVGAGIGAWRGKARAEETLVEREKAARKGVEDTSEEARQFINAEKSGDKLTNQINSLMDEMDKNGEKISRKLASLEAVVKFTRDKIDAGHVNYGAQEDRLRSRYNLLQEVAYAQAVVCAYSGDSEVASKIMHRMNSTLVSREQKITKAQSSYMKKQMLKGAAYGAGFAFAGAGIRHVGGQAVEATGLDEKFGRAISAVWGSDEASKAPGAGSGSDEARNIPPSGPLAGEGRAPESPDFAQGKVQEKITGTPDAISFNNPEAAVETESEQGAPTESEAPEIVEITGQQRITATAEYFGFKPVEGQEGAFVLDMAEAAKENANLGKLEQVLDRLVAAQYVDEFGESLEQEEAAKILNMAANLRVAFETGNASFMDRWTPEGSGALSELFRDSLEYDADNQTLAIKDSAKLEQLIDGLKAHADELAAGNNLEGAVGELPKIKQETWKEIVNAAQQKNIEVEDYLQDDRVKSAYETNRAREASAFEKAAPDAGAGEAEPAAVPEVDAAEAVARVERPTERELPMLLDEIKGINQRTVDPREKALIGLWEAVREYSVSTDTAKSHKLAAEYFLKLEPFADQYQDVRDMYTAGLEQMLDDEIRRGEGILRLGSANPEKLAEFSGKLGRMHGLDEQSSEIFVSWLAGEDAVLDRSDFKRLGLWASEDSRVKKDHFDAIAFEAKVKEFMDIAKSREVPQGGAWEPRIIRFDAGGGARHEEIVNIRAAKHEGKRIFEIDRIGAKTSTVADADSENAAKYPESQMQRSAQGGLEILQPDDVPQDSTPGTTPESGAAAAGEVAPEHKESIAFTTPDGRHITAELIKGDGFVRITTNGVVNPEIRQQAIPDDVRGRLGEFLWTQKGKSGPHDIGMSMHEIELGVYQLAQQKEIIEHAASEGYDVTAFQKVYNHSLTRLRERYPGILNYGALNLTETTETTDGPTGGYEGLLEKADGNTFEISHTLEDTKLKPGDKVRVYTTVQTIIHPKTGENLGTPQVDLGEATVKSVSDGSYKVKFDRDPLMVPEKSEPMRLVEVSKTQAEPATESQSSSDAATQEARPVSNPQESQSESAPTHIERAADAGFEEISNTEDAIHVFTDPAASYEQKMSALKGVMKDREHLTVDSFDLMRSGDRIMVVTGEAPDGKVNAYELTKENIGRFFDSYYRAQGKALEALQAEAEAASNPESGATGAPEDAARANTELLANLRSDLRDLGINPEGRLDNAKLNKLAGFYFDMSKKVKSGIVGQEALDALKGIIRDEYGIQNSDELDVRTQGKGNTPAL